MLAALEKHRGNQKLAAAELGMSRRTLLRRLDEYGAPRPRERKTDTEARADEGEPALRFPCAEWAMELG